MFKNLVKIFIFHLLLKKKKAIKRSEDNLRIVPNEEQTKQVTLAEVKANEEQTQETEERRELTTQEEVEINELVEAQAGLGLVSKALEFYSGTLGLKEEDYIKVNLPETAEKFKTGNGEGIWACPVTEEDKKIADSGEKGKTFQVYALNDCISYPFACASIITVQNTGPDTRPILDYTWIDETIKRASNNECGIRDVLSYHDLKRKICLETL